MKSVTYAATALLLAVLAAGLPATADAQDLSQAIADAAGVPQIPAFLPDKYSVARTEALPIDGLWMVSTIRKKIRIEQGRAYAADPWLHLFVLKVEPDMVVLQNFRRTGPGQYTADDLPLMGQAVMTVNAQGNLDVTVKGALGPVRYGLIRVESQYPQALTAEIQAATGQQVTIPDYSAPPATVAPLPGMPGHTPVAAQPGVQPAVQPVYQPQPQPQPVYQPQPQPVQQPIQQQPPNYQAQPGGGAPADCTPIGVDPDTGQTICAY